jgi:hypothetical protein
MTQTWLVFPAPAPADAVEVTIAAGAVGFYSGVPPAWSGVAEEQGWTLPCKVTLDENGVVVSWTPGV